MNNEIHQHTPDAELLERFYADHDNAWLGILMERYTMLLLGVCMKYLKDEEAARDAVQQVFLKVIGELHKYKVDYFKSWIYMIAKNHCLMKLRDKGRFTAQIDEQVLASPPETDSKKTYLEKDKALDNLEKALQQLNPEQHQCITLFYLQKQSYQEIGQQTGLSILQVKSHIQNGKRNLRIIMERIANNHE